jgi:hypothetical protein
MTTALTVPKPGFGIQEVEIRRRHLRLFADQAEVLCGTAVLWSVVVSR